MQRSSYFVFSTCRRIISSISRKWVIESIMHKYSNTSTKELFILFPSMWWVGKWECGYQKDTHGYFLICAKFSRTLYYASSYWESVNNVFHKPVYSYCLFLSVSNRQINTNLEASKLIISATVADGSDKWTGSPWKQFS